MMSPTDIFARIEALESQAKERDQERSLDDFMGKYGKRMSNDRRIGLKILNEMDNAGIDTAAADEVLQAILENLRTESLAQKAAIEDLIAKISGTSDAVANAINPMGGVSDTLTIPPEPPAMPAPVDPAMTAAPPPVDPATGAPVAPAAPPVDPAMAATAPPPAPPVEAAPTVAPTPAPVPSDLNLKEGEDNPTPDEALDEVAGDEAVEERDSLDEIISALEDSDDDDILSWSDVENDDGDDGEALFYADMDDEDEDSSMKSEAKVIAEILAGSKGFM